MGQKISEPDLPLSNLNQSFRSLSVMWLIVFHLCTLSGSTILEPINMSLESSNRTDKPEVAQHSNSYYRYRFIRVAKVPGIEMESADIGLRLDGLA